MKINAVLTGLVVSALTVPAFAKFVGTMPISNGKMTVEELERGEMPMEVKAKAFAVENDCSGQSVPQDPKALGRFLANGGVVFDDGVSGKIVTGDVQLDAILNLGAKAWKLIKDNAPSVETKLASANALPQGIQCWTQLERWRGFQYVDYKLTLKTVWGTSGTYVARVMYSYGGSFKGRGQYIANANVQNRDVKVNWAQKLNVDVEIPQVLNGGTTANPVAVMAVTLNVQLKNTVIPLRHLASSVTLILSGDGQPIRVL